MIDCAIIAPQMALREDGRDSIENSTWFMQRDTKSCSASASVHASFQHVVSEVFTSILS